MEALFRGVVDRVNQCQHWNLVLSRARSCAGGDINQAAILDCGSERLFVKYHRDPPAGMFDAELAALEELSRALSESDELRVPSPLATGNCEGFGFLAMECLPLSGSKGVAAAALGRGLARMHRHGQPYFGWTRDNTIGTTPQINQRCDSWIEFFGEHRLSAQIRMLAERGAPAGLARSGAELVSRLDLFFGGEEPQASLLHGDLWGGNWSAMQDGTAVIYDPASYYGDRETDLAMTELFGGFGPAFYDAYESEWPIDPGYAQRKPLYQLYHVLNHANLFGGGYVRQSKTLIDRLLEY